jgi:hypothetical protein
MDFRMIGAMIPPDRALEPSWSKLVGKAGASACSDHPAQLICGRRFQWKCTLCEVKPLIMTGPSSVEIIEREKMPDAANA